MGRRRDLSSSKPGGQETMPDVDLGKLIGERKEPEEVPSAPSAPSLPMFPSLLPWVPSRQPLAHQSPPILHGFTVSQQICCEKEKAKSSL